MCVFLCACYVVQEPGGIFSIAFEPQNQHIGKHIGQPKKFTGICKQILNSIRSRLIDSNLFKYYI